MSQSEQVSGNEKRKIRSTTRLYAIQALFQMEQLGLSTDEVVEEFVVHRFGEEYEAVSYTHLTLPTILLV